MHKHRRSFPSRYSQTKDKDSAVQMPLFMPWTLASNLHIPSLVPSSHGLNHTCALPCTDSTAAVKVTGYSQQDTISSRPAGASLSKLACFDVCFVLQENWY